MAGILLGLAVLAAVGVAGARWLAGRRASTARTRKLSGEVGYSAEHPLPIATFQEMDDFVEMARCPCGGLLERIGEGSRPGVRVVRCACMACEDDVDLFFDLSALRH